MKIEKIIINKDGDFRIKRNGKLIKCKGILQTYKKDDDLSQKLNENIVNIINSDECIIIDYIEPVLTFEQVQQNKINELRQQRDYCIDFNNIKISISDINRYMYVMIGTDTDIQSRLPKKITNDFTLETVEQVKGLSVILDNHNKKYDSKILECENATTIEEIEAI